MKRLFIIFSLILTLVVPTTALAHPGRTDSNGGHTCKTNCEKWGLEYSQYHWNSREIKDSI